MNKNHPEQIGCSAPINLAGETIEKPLAAIARYLGEHKGTVANYDLITGESDEVAPQMIRVTRRHR